jgi:hypothetical protein
MTTRPFLSEFLEDRPDILFQAMRPQDQGPGRGRSFLDYWRGRQGNVWDDYLGSIGKAALAGEIPTQTFQSFLGDYPWQQYWSALSPSQRGDRSGLLTPQLRWNL